MGVSLRCSIPNAAQQDCPGSAPLRQKSVTGSSPSERLVKTIRRATRKQYSAEEKIRIVLDGLRGESSIAELCRREGIAEGLYYSWSKEFLEAGSDGWPVTPPVQRRAAK